MPAPLRRISYVDEPDIEALAEFALTQIGGNTVQLCGNGLEALEKAPAFKPDLILLDVMMPGMDGIETFSRLKKTPGLKDTPVVFMTARVMQEEVKHYRSMGAADVIPKPFDPLTLSDRLCEIWERVSNEAYPPGGSHGGKRRGKAA